MLRKANREITYFRVIVVYIDGESSGNRVFKNRAKAEQWAARQKKAPVVKRVNIAEFKRASGDWLKPKPPVR